MVMDISLPDSSLRGLRIVFVARRGKCVVNDLLWGAVALRQLEDTCRGDCARDRHEGARKSRYSGVDWYAGV